MTDMAEFGRRELDRIRKQIRHYLQQAVSVGRDLNLRLVVNQQHACLIGHRLHAVHCLPHDFTQLHRPESKRLTSALRALQVENVVDQTHQAL